MEPGNVTIAIEGNIGVGKSTFGRSLLEYMQNHSPHDVEFQTEPFNQKMLEQFLKDPKKYAYTFQMYMLTRRQLNYALSKQSDCVSIIDRSLAGDYVFAKLQLENGHISEEEFEIYQSVYDEFGPYKPDYVIFLNVSPNLAMKRIKKRSRNGESSYTMEYLKQLDKVYHETISAHYPPDSGVKVYTLDWSEEHELSENGTLPNNVCKKIVDLIKNKDH